MFITLEKRTADSVRTYFEKANRPEIKQVLPQKARTIEEALQDYEQTLLPNAESFGAIALIWMMSQTVCSASAFLNSNTGLRV